MFKHLFDGGQILNGILIAGVDLDGLLQFLACTGEIALDAQQIAKVIVSSRGISLQDNGLAIGGDGFVELADALVGDAKVNECRGKICFNF